MRCLFLVATFPSQGTCLRAEAIARVFAARGHAVDLCAVSPLRQYRRDERLIRGGIRRFEMPRWTPGHVLDPMEGWNPLDLLQRFGVALRGRYDLAYAFEHKPACFWPARLARLKGARLLLDRCDAWGGEDGNFRGFVETHPRFLSEVPRWKRAVRVAGFRLEERMERRAPLKSAAVTAISRLLREETIALGVPGERVHLLYTPASVDAFEPLDKAAERRKRGLPEGVPILGMAATYVPEEEQLWPLWRGMLEEVHGLRLLLLGTGFASPPDWTREGPLAERVTMTGFIPFEEVGAWLSACDLLWCPLEDRRFNRARFPQKFFDYIATGRPVLACDAGDIGALVREKDLGGAAQGLDGLARLTLEAIRSPERWDEWGANARRAAERDFSPEAAAKGLEPFMRRFLPEGVEF